MNLEELEKRREKVLDNPSKLKYYDDRIKKLKQANRIEDLKSHVNSNFKKAGY